MMDAKVPLWMLVLVLAGSVVFGIVSYSSISTYKSIATDAQNKVQEVVNERDNAIANSKTLETQIDTMIARSKDRAQQYAADLKERDQSLTLLESELSAKTSKLKELSGIFNSKPRTCEESVQWLSEQSSQLYW